MTSGAANIALFAAAAALLITAFPYSSVVLGARESRGGAVAEAALDLIAAREQVQRRQSYAVFGPGPGEREAALPGLHLGEAEADIAFDAILEADGALRLRALSRPDAVAAGRIVPLLRARVLGRGAEHAHAEQAHEERDAQTAGPAAATR